MFYLYIHPPPHYYQSCFWFLKLAVVKGTAIMNTTVCLFDLNNSYNKLLMTFQLCFVVNYYPFNNILLLSAVYPHLIEPPMTPITKQFNWGR